MNTLDRLKKWARDHAKNPNAILRLYRKMTATEKLYFMEELSTKEGRVIIKGKK